MWYQGAMATLKWWIVTALLGYGGLVGLMYLAQRSMLFAPDTARTPPAAAGLPQASEVTLVSGDGTKVLAWHIPPADGRPVVIFFQGNGGALRGRTNRFRTLTADGTGLVALAYPGYGGSEGRPSEDSLIGAGFAAYAFAAERYPPERIALWGESMGGAVAIAVAAEKPVARMILESPFTSAVDLAASMYWFVPVRLLMKDPFRSDLRVGKVTAPTLVMHGVHDRLVPISHSERLMEMIRAPKKFVRFENGSHNDLDSQGATATVKRFLAGELD